MATLVVLSKVWKAARPDRDTPVTVNLDLVQKIEDDSNEDGSFTWVYFNTKEFLVVRERAAEIRATWRRTVTSLLPLPSEV